MLGYVKCDQGEMLVKHYRLYQAVYCGLCHSIRKNASVFLLPFLSYDFVFLAALRQYASGEEGEVEKQFCFYHPLAKKQRMKDNDALSFSARASLILTVGKMQDDLLDGDSSFARRLVIRSVFPFLQRKIKKLQKQDASFRYLSQEVFSYLQETREKEKNKESLDIMCSEFARILSLFASYGFEGNEKKLLSAVGDHLGRWIYTLDALDDLEEDEKNGSFNPLLIRYGSFQKAKEHFPEIDMVLSFYVEQMKSVFDLTEGNENFGAICENIICRGLPIAARKAMKIQ